MTEAPRLRRLAERLPAWCRARPTRIRVPARGWLWLGFMDQASGLRCQISGVRGQVFVRPDTCLRLLRHGETFTIDFFENNIAASAEKGIADFSAQAYGIVALVGFAQDFCSIGTSYDRVQANAASLHFGEGSDGDLATAAKFAEQGTLTGGATAGGSVIEKCDNRLGRRVAIANFDCQGALSGGGGHHFHRDQLTDQLCFAQTIQAGGGENDGIVVAGLELAQARIHIAADWMNLKIRTNGLQLSLTSQTAGANVRLLRQRFDAREFHGTQNVAWIFAGGNRGNFEVGGQLRWQIFQAVHREVNTIVDESLFDFLGEHTLRANLREGDVGDFIAGGLDDLQFHGMALGAEQIGD